MSKYEKVKVCVMCGKTENHRLYDVSCRLHSKEFKKKLIVFDEGGRVDRVKSDGE